MELWLSVDVAFIWFPNAGKSTLLATLTHARPKIASYPFTTLVPYIGIHKYNDNAYTLLDIPWLIQYASEWVWLWLQFLQHTLRAKILLFVINLDEDTEEQVRVLWQEVTSFGEQYFSLYTIKKEKDAIRINAISHDGVEFTYYAMFAINKCDILDKDEYKEYQKDLAASVTKVVWKKYAQKAVHVISWKHNILCDELIIKLSSYIDEMADVSLDILNQEEEKRIEVTDITSDHLEKLVAEWYLKDDVGEDVRVWYIDHPEIVYFSYILPWSNMEAEMWFWEYMNKKWVLKYLQRCGAKRGDVFFMDSPYHWYEERYIWWI